MSRRLRSRTPEILAAAAIAVIGSAVTAPAGSDDRTIAYLVARQQPDGGFAEPGRRSDPSLTAWAVLGLAAAGRPPDRAAGYLESRPAPGANELALRILALRALGRPAGADVERLEGLRRRDGRIGPLVNSTIWSILALRAAGRPAGRASIRYLLARQARSGGWPWAPRGAPDSNDTAAAIQALRASGVRGRPIRRGVAYLLRRRNRDGGFGLLPGRASDTQSTAWAIQALITAGRRPPRPAFRYLARMRRPDGSYRYSVRYATTPTWVTAQVLPALARKPFPIR